MKPRKDKPGKREAMLRHNLTAEEYKALSVPGSAEFPSGQAPKGKRAKTAPRFLPLNFLLGCAKQDLENFELARLSDVSDLRVQLHQIFDRLVDNMAQAALVAWFKTQDRSSLKHAIENEESPEEWAKRVIRDGQRSEEELFNFRIPTMEPGSAHLAAALRYQERNIAEGKCSVCPAPLDRNSVRFCSKHLAMSRDRDRRKKGLRSDPGTREYLYTGEITQDGRGRAPGNLARLEMAREQKTRAVLAELGIPPESAAVTLEASKEALLKAMPRTRKEALTQPRLREAATVPSKNTCIKALNQLLAEGKIQRTGKGGTRDVFRYFSKRGKP